MRAIVFAPPEPRARLRTVDLAPPGPGEVEVVIAAAGVCHSDLHVVNGDWDVAAPVVLGHEGSGVVASLGPGVSSHSVGDHVVLSWVPSCGRCGSCLGGRPAQCEPAAKVTAPLGVLFDGTSRLSVEGERVHHYCAVSSFAERAVVPATGAIRIRRDAPLDLVALVGCAVSTGVGAVRNTANVPAGATVAIIGCGGVGLSCVQGARLAEASRIVAVDVVPAKLDLARQLGATDVIDAQAADPVSALRGLLPDGVDFAFDAIGKTTTTEQCIALLGLGGAAVLVGLPPRGQHARFDPLSLVEADQRILGSNYGSIDPQRDIPMLVDLFMQGSLELEVLVSARRPLADAPDALAELGKGQALRQLLIP